MPPNAPDLGKAARGDKNAERGEAAGAELGTATALPLDHIIPGHVGPETSSLKPCKLCSFISMSSLRNSASINEPFQPASNTLGFPPPSTPPPRFLLRGKFQNTHFWLQLAPEPDFETSGSLQKGTCVCVCVCPGLGPPRQTHEATPRLKSRPHPELATGLSRTTGHIPPSAGPVLG